MFDPPFLKPPSLKPRKDEAQANASAVSRPRTRRRYEEEPENHDRWLVSYADLLTLLFAFFVVMYAISSVNTGKYRVLSNSLLQAFAIGATPTVEERKEAPPARILPPAPKQREESMRRERDHMTRIARDILTVLAPLVDQGKVRVAQTDLGVKVEINASVLFAPGDAKLTHESSEALTAVAKVLKDDERAIQIEGHTDSVPINNASFPSNWELSAVRASSVARLFVDNGVADKRLTVVGKGPTQPVSPNDTVEGRLRNRRVTVIIMSALPETVTEVPVENPRN